MLHLNALITLCVALLGRHVRGHGIVTGIVADGVYYEGYSPSLQYGSPPPAVVGWSVPLDSNYGFVDPRNYTNPDIICHSSATPGQVYAMIVAGGTLELQWTPWPSTHHGPVITYLANCNGDCTTVDKTTLLFNKIDSVGLVNDNVVPGYWAADQLKANNNTWTVIIPSTIARGNYVLRHEIIALHAAETLNGTQNYPQCVNLQVTGSGTDELTSGTLGEDLYTPNDPGILVNIYATLSSYMIPGPTPWSGAAMTTQTPVVAALTMTVPPLEIDSETAPESVFTVVPSSVDTHPVNSAMETTSRVASFPVTVSVSTTTPASAMPLIFSNTSLNHATESTSAAITTCVKASTSTITMTATKTVTTFVECTNS